MVRLILRIAMMLAMLCVVPQGAAAQTAAAWRANPDDALLLDVRLNQYRLGDGVRGYATPTGPCVDLADTLLALDIPVRLDKSVRRASGWAFEERHTIAIDRAAGTEQVTSVVRNLAVDDVRDTPEGWCVAVPVLARWLGVGVVADTANALLIIKADHKLPPEAAAERRARAAAARPAASFDLATLPSARFVKAGVRPPAIDVVASVGGLNDRTGNSRRVEASYEFYAAGELGPVAYNARLASDRTGTPNSLRVQAFRTDPKGGLLGPLHATFVAAGDVQGLATPLVTDPGVGRGAVVTNRPVERRDRFDRTDFRGALPRGWDAELYRNGQLLAFAQDRADGRYEFLDVPLQYGQNRFEIVLYGPQGQTRREVRNVPVGLDSIPPRKTYYWAGVFEDQSDLIDLGAARPLGSGWRGSFGLERGLDSKTSVAATLSSIYLDDVARRNFAEVSTRRALGAALVEVSGAAEDNGGVSGRAQVIGQAGSTLYTVETIWADGFRSDRILQNVTGLHSVSIDQSFGSGSGTLPMHLDARLTTRSTGIDTIDVASRISANMGLVSLTGEVSWHDDRVPSGIDPPGILETGLLANARVGRVRVRGEARFRVTPETRFEAMALVSEWSSGHADRSNDWRAEIGYDRSLGRGRAGLGYIRKFDRFALNASAEAATDGSVAAGLSVAFSIGPDPRSGGSMRVTTDKLAQRGSALVRVWRDLNGNGVHDPGEPWETGVQATAGRVAVETPTDARGEVVIDGLEPYQPVLVGIDASSLPDPRVQPAIAGRVATPRPGVAAIVELPLVSAGDIDGTLVRSGGGTIEGVDLELLDTERRVVAHSQTEFDGFFLFENIPYGRYTMRIAALSAAAARLDARLSAGATIGSDAPSAHLGAVRADPDGGRTADTGAGAVVGP